MKNIVIIGAGDLGKEVVWLIEDINKYRPTYLILGFLDDDENKKNKEFYGYKVLGNTKELENIEKKMPFSAVLAIQEGRIRKKIVEEHKDFQHWESIIHPTAVIASTVSVGKGNIIFPQVTMSVDSKVGSYGLFYIHATVCNDCRIGDFVSVMSGVQVSERVVVGTQSYLAAGCCIYPSRILGECVKVAVGATVSKDYGDGEEVREKGGGFSLFK